MRVLFVDSDPQYINGMAEGLRQVGCDVLVLKTAAEEDLELAYELFRPHVLFTAGWNKIHTRDNLNNLGTFTKRHNLVHVYWATEDPRWTKKWSLPYIETTKPTHVFTIDPGSVSLYRKMGLVSAYITWACNPEYHRPVPPKEEYRCDIAVVATAGVSWRGFRRQSVRTLVKPLVENGYDVKIWGKRWDKLDPHLVGFSVPEKCLCGKLPYEETNAVYSSAKIVLGIQSYTGELTARTFEITAAGGFMLASDTPAIRKIFQPGKHLAVSGSEKETLKIVDYYLKHEAERKKIACRGRRLVTEKFTYRHRAKELLLSGG
ncbi:spore maturation protein CgeB [Desulfohalotomaculum tongense]|uniref:CgeB family protein n=1 Tax=Desulforadius tongensis TaxID=1216062 RepID=UPI00195BADB0|nr:glycosyltransferase [Desulforadius tongensis]MBM7855535.1 spore maturation protein CgeB [Desulforadius tongensis]